MRNVVDRMRRPHRRVKSQDIAAQFEIPRRLVGEELVAVFEDRPIERAEVLLRRMAVRRVRAVDGQSRVHSTPTRTAVPRDWWPGMPGDFPSQASSGDIFDSAWE